VLAVGGGTGSAFLNETVSLAAPLWTSFAELVHVTGLEKTPLKLPSLTHPGRYHPLEFVGEDIVHYFAAADVVITRAGMGTLTELAALSKPAVIVPIPDSHQEVNAAYVAERGGGLVLRELDLTPEQLVTFTKSLLDNRGRAKALGEGLHRAFKPGARERLAEKLIDLASPGSRH
jgi:UDP-N-acetylglucosamine:LPS N-acetylglucosamine transferase